MKKVFALLLALALLLSCATVFAEDVVGAPADLVEAAKANPGQITYGCTVGGSASVVAIPRSRRFPFCVLGQRMHSFPA